MAFDPVTLLTISVAVLLALGGVMLQSSRGDRFCLMLRWSGLGFLAIGLGFVLVLAAPTAIDAPVRVLGNGLIMLGYGSLWGAARKFDQRSAPALVVGAGALVWLVLSSLFDPSQAVRIAITSAILASYSAATAWEHRRDDDVTSGGHLQSQRWITRVFAGHAAFFLLRLLFGSTFGLVDWGLSVQQFWSALLGFETVLFAVLVGVTSIAMSRERTERAHRREALEDPLTGIGNRRALFRSGPALLEGSRIAGRPAALLLMDLDGFKIVNDCHGHPAGDRLLIAFARVAHDYLPPTSLVCRIGGEEFAALLPGADLERAHAVADEIRALFAHVALESPAGPLNATVSVGVAAMRAEPMAEEEISELLSRADICLYAAKRSGRDRVVSEGDPALADPALAQAWRRSAA
ncbi:MAG: GGDEF domain-containing protein [Janthinobacterium lividum]